MVTRSGGLITSKPPLSCLSSQINPNNYSLKFLIFPKPLLLLLSPSRSLLVSCYSNSPINSATSSISKKTPVISSTEEDEEYQWRTQEGTPLPQTQLPSVANLSIVDKTFFLFAFVACTTSVAFTSLVIATVPMLHAMGRTAIAFSKLADTAREELPSTMAAIRLSGMEISDLTLELSDLSQEITEGVNKSAQAVQAAEAGIRQIGSRARQQTMSMIEERANLPNLSLQPAVMGAAKKTSRAVGQATKTFMNMISGGENSSNDDDENAIEKLEI